MASPNDQAAPSKKAVALSVLAQTNGRVPMALARLAERGVSVDRSYVYEIKRNAGKKSITSISVVFVMFIGNYTGGRVPSFLTQ